MKSTGKDKKIKASFEFLREKAKVQKTFNLDELSGRSGWSKINTQTNISKRLKQFVIRTSLKDTFGVKPSILEVPYQDYLSLFKQADVLTPDYTEYINSEVAVFELFLPLSCEGKLRQALDKLFYRDAVIEKIEGVGIERFRKIIELNKGESDISYLNKLCDFVAKEFGGYSISNVNGRFRVGNLLSKAEALEAENEGANYLINETTAVVKFIVPIQSSESLAVDDQNVETVQLSMDLPEKNVDLEQIEWLFHNIFISTILNTVGQEEIWVLESGVRSRLNRYVAKSSDA
jgi:hypothetical protein